MVKILDLGCGNNKLKGAFGVDFVKLPSVDFIWDLNKELPKRFHNKYDVVYTKCTIDHMGNPMDFLYGCKKYLKKGGNLILIVDNGDYWRYHLHLGTYHADIWENNDPNHPETHHKMLFQMKHLIKLFSLIGFEIKETNYYSDYYKESFLKRIIRGHIDFLLPKYLGCNLMKIESIKT